MNFPKRLVRFMLALAFFSFSALSRAEEAEEKLAEPATKPAAKVKAKRNAANLEALAVPLQVLFGGNAFGGGNAAGAIAIQMPGAAAAQNDAMIQQFVQQFRPFAMEELAFIRLVCSDLSKEQRSKIKAAADASLKQAAKQMADLQNRQQNGFGGGGFVGTPEPRKIIRTEIAKTLKVTLNPEQTQRYNAEAAERKETRKQTAIVSVVSRLDGSLILSAEQRQSICDELSSQWQEKWEQWLMLSVYGQEYVPVIPDKNIVPHLNSDQKIVWEDLQKIEIGYWWGGHMAQPENDGWWGEEAEPQNAGGAMIFGGFVVGGQAEEVLIEDNAADEVAVESQE